MALNSTASMGHQAKAGIKEETTYGTTVTVDYGIPFVSENVRAVGSIIERVGIRGTRQHIADDTRTGPTRVGGPLVIEPSPEDMAVLLPWLLGADASGTTYDLAETLQSFTFSVDRVAKVFVYGGCVIARASITGQVGSMLRWALDLIAQSETVNNAGTFPAITINATTPYIISDMTLTLGGSSRQCNGFELVIDNGIVADRFMNSLNIVDAPSEDQLIALTTTHPYTSTNTDLYAQALAGAAGTLALATAGYATSFAFGTLQVPRESPTVGSKAEIMLPLSMMARKTGSTPALRVTHDSTP